jgi:hypothetical protein
MKPPTPIPWTDAVKLQQASRPTNAWSKPVEAGAHAHGGKERNTSGRWFGWVPSLGPHPRLHVTVTTMRRWFGVLDAPCTHAHKTLRHEPAWLGRPFLPNYSYSFFPRSHLARSAAPHGGTGYLVAVPSLPCTALHRMVWHGMVWMDALVNSTGLNHWSPMQGQ